MYPESLLTSWLISKASVKLTLVLEKRNVASLLLLLISHSLGLLFIECPSVKRDETPVFPTAGDNFLQNLGITG